MTKPHNDIVFLFPPASGNRGVFKQHLGVSYLRAALEQAGFSTSQYMNMRPGTIREVVRDIVRMQTPIVGFTVYDANAALCISLAEAIKAQKPGIKIVFGGPTATFNATRLMERYYTVDACFLGEAEECGAPFFAKLLANTMTEAQPGVAFRTEGEVVCGSLPPLLGEKALSAKDALDQAPSPYLTGILSDGRPGVLSGRGCYHHCQYCCFAALGRKRLRLHSTERVLAELEYIAAQQTRCGDKYVVPIHDDAFTLVPDRAKLLCQAIADRHLNLALSCITRADAIDEELIGLMRAAGFVSLAFGLESAVPSVLRATGKVRPPDFSDPELGPERQFIDRVRNSVVTAKKYGLNVGVSIILGLPTETKDQGLETVRFVGKLPVDYYMHNFLWIFPGTPLWETHDKYGVTCTTNEFGLATTTGYAYNLNDVRPRSKCALEQDANFIRQVATNVLYSCDSPLASKGTSAVVLEAGQISPETARWLKEIMALGGVILQIYPPLSRGEQSARLYQDRCIISEQFVPVRHHIQLFPKRSALKSEEWFIACAGVDLYRKHKPELVSISCTKEVTPLELWAARRDFDADLCDMADEAEQPRNMPLPAGKLDNGPSTLRDMPVPPGIMYAGRWLKGRSPCHSLSRIEVDNQGNVRCCHAAQPIGKVGDTPAVMIRNLDQIMQQVARRRECSKCGNRNCPRCPFPGVSDEVYCKTISAWEQSQGSLNLVRTYSRIPWLVAEQRDRMAAE